MMLQNTKLRKIFIFSYVGWMERKKTLGRLILQIEKKLLNLSNKIINKNFKNKIAWPQNPLR